MLKFKVPAFRQILRFNPAISLEKMKEFRFTMSGELIYDDWQEFDLRCIAFPPHELVKRTIQDVMKTDSKARAESKRLIKKYDVDNIWDWRREHWFGVSENCSESEWKDDYTLHITSEERLYPVLLYLATKYKLEFYYSYMDEGNEYFEDSCGISRITQLNEFHEPGNDKFELFAFASVLLAGHPLSFEMWENENISGDKRRYYLEHFIEENAQNRMEKAFNDTNGVLIANLMVNKDLSNQRVWDALTKLF